MGDFGFIKNVKVDIVRYEHPLIARIDIIDNIRMFSQEDICAMKVNAILGRGTKKDFWDMYELLNHFTLSKIISFHQKKFSTQLLLISIPQALTYFHDAEESVEPISLKGQDWATVKEFIQDKVREYLS